VRILLIEDDLQLGGALTQALQQAGFEIVWVRRLAEARAHLDFRTAAAVLDINLPDGEGFSLLEQMRRDRAHLPVLIMTARDALSDRLRGLDAGADDYLVKPFAVSELIARLRAIMRRSSGQAGDVWTFGDLLIDARQQRVSVASQTVALTPTEYRLLLELCRAAGRVLARALLIDLLWPGAEQGSEAALEMQVHGLRKKIGARRIRTVRGSGYALESA
jgi:two-component system, OmpR family, response regulator QseB